MPPRVTLYDYSYDGIDKDSAMVSLIHHTYYQTTLSYAIYNLTKGTSVYFQNVTFAFPGGTMITPGGSFVMLDIKFPDGSEEIYGANITTPGGSGIISGIKVPAQYGPSFAKNSVTVLSNHLKPQAGLTIYHDKIKLLVSNYQTSTNSIVLSEPQFVEYSSALTAPHVGSEELIQSELKNRLLDNLNFTYIVQVKNQEGVTVSLDSVQGKLAGNESVKAALRWIPDSGGTYRIETFVWNSLVNPFPLAPSQNTTGIVAQKTLLWVDTYPEYAVHDLRLNVIKGHLFASGWRIIPEKEIKLYLESIRIGNSVKFYDEQMTKIAADRNGCFYLSGIGYNLEQVYHNFTGSQEYSAAIKELLQPLYPVISDHNHNFIDINDTAVAVTLRFEFDGDDENAVSIAKSRIYYHPKHLGLAEPPIRASMINETKAVSEITIDRGSTADMQVWVNNDNNTGKVELSAKNLPCGVSGEFEPRELSFKNEYQKIVNLKIKVANDAKLGTYPIYIVTGQPASKIYLNSYLPTIDEFETSLLEIKLRIR